MELSKLVDVVVQTVEEERVSESLHPSALRQCDRRMMLSQQGVKKSHPMDKETSWKLARFGTYEALFASAFERNLDKEWAAQHELRWLDFHGYVDFVVRDGDEVIFAEIKSTAPGAFSKGSMPYEAHKAQAQSYYIMAHESGADVLPTTTAIVYIGRWYDGKLPEFRVFDVTPSAFEYDELKRYMELLQNFKDTNHVPDVPFGSSQEHPWLCTRMNWKAKEREVSCPYYDHCWLGELPL